MIKCNSKNRIIKFSCAVFALFFVIPSLFSCASTDKGLSISDYLYFGKGSQYHIFSEDVLKVAESEHTRLYFDRYSMGIAIYDELSANAYYSLPCKEGNASVLQVTATGENGTFTLNSQDNCVAYSAADYEQISNGIKVNYRLSNDKITTDKSRDKLIPGELLISLSIEYTLSAGALFTRVDCSDIFVSDGYRLTELSVLNDFGAAYSSAPDYISELSENQIPTTAAKQEETTAESDEQEKSTTEKAEEDSEPAEEAIASENRAFILLPDGCGAIMYTDIQNPVTDTVSFEVYGDDAGVGEAGSHSASYPAYGMKQGTGAFVSIIDSGSELATITAYRRNGENSYEADRIGATFRLTPAQSVDNKIYFSKSYDGEILICNRFLSETEATYTGMAAACREEFMRTGVLSGQQTQTDDTNLNISILFGSNGTKAGTAATFSQVEDTLALLKAKGIDNIRLILRGVLSGGLVRDDTGKFSLLRYAGSHSDYESLYSYAQKQKFDIYIGCGVLTMSSFNGKKAIAADGSSMKTVVTNSLYPFSGENYLSASLLSVGQIENNIIEFINGAKSYSFDGYCVSDAAKLLYSDSEFTRTEAAYVTSKGMQTLATQNRLMLEGSNFTCLAKAESLLDIPFETQYAADDSYVAVPFLQTILHSAISYSGSPINTAAIPTLLMLKYIEYGAVLYFEWSFDSDNSMLYYDNSLSDAVEWFNDVENGLSDLSDDRITSHSLVAENVYRTGYDCGSYVYVNYNNYSVNIGNISVPAYGFFRVN